MSRTEHAPRMAPTAGCSFVARHDFLHFGKVFKAGDAFPYANLGLTEDQALQLWRCAQLEVALDSPVADVPALVEQAAGAAADLLAGTGSKDDVAAATAELVAATEAPADEAAKAADDHAVTSKSSARAKHTPARK